jgi:PhnB protein
MERNRLFRRKELVVSETSDSGAEIRAVPEGYHAVTPWIISRDTAGLMEFVGRAFGAEEIARVHNEDGSIGHAEFRIGDSVVMGFDAKPEWPEAPAFLRLYVEDADKVYRRALEAGATSVTEVTHLFWGDRVGRVRDPYGNLWWIQARVEEVDPTEMERRAGQKELKERMAYVQESLDRELGNRTRRAGSRSVQSTKGRSIMDWKLELVAIPVSDVDRAKAFYTEKAGFNADHDHTVSDELRFVQLTPPGSACSIAIGKGVVDSEPGSAAGLQLVVADINAARRELVERGVDVSDVQELPGGRFVFFSDPDGNRWSVQEISGSRQNV